MTVEPPKAATAAVYLEQTKMQTGVSANTEDHVDDTTDNDAFDISGDLCSPPQARPSSRTYSIVFMLCVRLSFLRCDHSLMTRFLPAC